MQPPTPTQLQLYGFALLCALAALTALDTTHGVFQAQASERDSRPIALQHAPASPR